MREHSIWVVRGASRLAYYVTQPFNFSSDSFSLDSTKAYQWPTRKEARLACAAFRYAHQVYDFKVFKVVELRLEKDE